MKKMKMFCGVLTAMALVLTLSSVANAQMLRHTTIILDDGSGVMTPITGTSGGGITIGGGLTSNAHTILDANGNKTVLQASTRAAASPQLTFTLPSNNTAGALMNDGAGGLSWTSIPGLTTTPSFTNVTLTGASNQFIIQPGGAGNTLTFTATNPATSHVINWGDPGSDASIVYTHNLGTQDIVGKKSFQNLGLHDSVVTGVSGTLNLNATSTSSFTISSASADFTIGKVTGGYDGKMLRIYNKSGKNMTLKNGAGTDSLYTYANGDIVLTADGAVSLVYDGTRWTGDSYTANNVIGTIGSTSYAIDGRSGGQAVSGTGMTDHDSLQITVQGGQVWEIQGTLIVTGDANSTNMNWTTTTPASSTQTISYSSYKATNGASSLQGAGVLTTSGTNLGVDVGTSTTFVDYRGLIVVGSGGAIKIRFCSSVAGGTITMAKNSYMRVTRIR